MFSFLNNVVSWVIRDVILYKRYIKELKSLILLGDSSVCVCVCVCVCVYILHYPKWPSNDKYNWSAITCFKHRNASCFANSFHAASPNLLNARIIFRTVGLLTSVLEVFGVNHWRDTKCTYWGSSWLTEPILQHFQFIIESYRIFRRCGFFFCFFVRGH